MSGRTMMVDVVGPHSEVHLESQEKSMHIQTAECRICQEEDSLEDLETPCICSGSLQYAHRSCLLRWCSEKGHIMCEICQEPYKPGYSAYPQRPRGIATSIHDGWTLEGRPLDFNRARILAAAQVQRREFLSNEYVATNATGAVVCRFAALIFLAILVLRHLITIGLANNKGDHDAYHQIYLFSLHFLRVAGVLLPCFLMAWAIATLLRRRQRQVAVELSAEHLELGVQDARRAAPLALSSPRTSLPEP